jgi:hypothetical protein
VTNSLRLRRFQGSTAATRESISALRRD